MNAAVESNPEALVRRLLEAQNRHDLDAFVACFDPNYRSEQPVHPERAFVGSDQVRRNWSGIFGSTPDFHSELLRSARTDDTIWTEWDWGGTRPDGTIWRMRGAVIFGIEAGLIHWARLYMEPMEQAVAEANAKSS